MGETKAAVGVSAPAQSMPVQKTCGCTAFFHGRGRARGGDASCWPSM